MDLEAAKKATVDSMEVAMEKQRVTHAGGNDESRNAKETIIVNQPGNNTTTTTTTTNKRKVEQYGKRSCNCRSWCSYWSDYK
jgi:hypothetical protein